MVGDHILHLFSSYPHLILVTVEGRCASLKDRFAIVIAQMHLLLLDLYFWSLWQHIEAVIILHCFLVFRLLLMIIRFSPQICFGLIVCRLLLVLIFFIEAVSDVIAGLLFILHRDGFEFVLQVDLSECLTVSFSKLVQLNKRIIE